MKGETIANCPKCGTVGTVTDNWKNVLRVECPTCRHAWKTVSKTCGKCGKPNYYVVDGICSRCYAASRKAD